MLLWLGISAIVIFFDQISKMTITRLFTYAENLPLTSFFNLTLAYNPGSAFNFLADQTGWQRIFFTVLGLGAAAYICYLLSRHAGKKLFCWALALIMGGALGNVIDRIAYGHVIDFLDFHYQELYHFPAFNLADSAIFLGAMLFILDELRREKNKE